MNAVYRFPNFHAQRGVALVAALIFLVMITLIAVTMMRSSTLELLMASNQQQHTVAVQAAQSAADTVTAGTGIVVTNVGDVMCFGATALTPTGVTCTSTTGLTGTGISSTASYVGVSIDKIGPCPRTVSNSARGGSSLRAGASSSSSGSCAYLSVGSIYDDTGAGGGRANIVEGDVRLIY